IGKDYGRNEPTLSSNKKLHEGGALKQKTPRMWGLMFLN
ncbi:uncharacterized protein METZ01_LOCUS509744, partial [marine metagenome]